MRDQDYFIENLTMLLDSGMGISAALNSLKLELKTAGARKEVELLIEEIESGSPLWKALAKSKLVSKHNLSLIRVGEESGRLSENLNVVVVEEQKNRILKANIRSAMAYPVLVLSMTVLVGLGMSWFILPRLATTFQQLKIDLPFITQVLINAGQFIGQYGYVTIPLTIGLSGFVVYLLFFFNKSKFLGDRLLLATPGISKLLKEVEIARFGYMLGNLLDAGLTINDSLSSLSGATEFYDHRKIYESLRNSIEEGNSLKKSFEGVPKAKKYFPLPVQHMIAAGEASGSLSKTLIKIGEIYESKSAITTKNLSTLLEPLLLFIVWLAVMGVALAIIIPIYGLIGGIK